MSLQSVEKGICLRVCNSDELELTTNNSTKEMYVTTEVSEIKQWIISLFSKRTVDQANDLFINYCFFSLSEISAFYDLKALYEFPKVSKTSFYVILFNSLIIKLCLGGREIKTVYLRENNALLACPLWELWCCACFVGKQRSVSFGAVSLHFGGGRDPGTLPVSLSL